MSSDTPTERPRVHSKKRAATALGISERTLDRMRAASQIRSIRVSPRRVVIPEEEIDRILQASDPKAA